MVVRYPTNADIVCLCESYDKVSTCLSSFFQRSHPTVPVVFWISVPTRRKSDVAEQLAGGESVCVFYLWPRKKDDSRPMADQRG